MVEIDAVKPSKKHLTGTVYFIEALQCNLPTQKSRKHSPTTNSKNSTTKKN